MVMHGTHTTDY